MLTPEQILKQLVHLRALTADLASEKINPKPRNNKINPDPHKIGKVSQPDNKINQ